MTTKTDRTPIPSADAWFAGGARLAYDPAARRLEREAPPGAGGLRVFIRREGAASRHATFLGGFPDGSYGWARTAAHLPPPSEVSRLFVEYVGQGDSDKPRRHPYGTLERADLVEAAWAAYDVRETALVCFDYSSLVAMEILDRRLSGRVAASTGPRITGVFIFNGGLFTDSHSHPWDTTPLLRSPLGAQATWAAQRSRFIFGQMAQSLWSKDYRVSRDEIDELFNVVTRRDGAAFLHFGAGFVAEHKSRLRRLDFARLFRAYKDAMPFMVGGSTLDPFEPKQVRKARRLLEPEGLMVRELPGGHLTTSEQPAPLAGLIREFLAAVEAKPRSAPTRAAHRTGTKTSA